MKILITGAGGFLGKYLAQQLIPDHNVVALTKQELDLSNQISVSKHFESAQYDAVIHCAVAGRNTPAIEDWSIVNSNLSSVLNLMTHRQKFEKLINIGSGAEFDITTNIDNIQETEIFNRNPKYSYGLSKNIIARYLYEQPNCFTLRLFGCFGSDEDDRRLLKKFHSVVSTGKHFDLQDRKFDMISVNDFKVIVDSVLNNIVTHQNINCVYAQKYRLSEILSVYCDKHGLNKSLINVTGQGLSYTGNGDILRQYNLPLQGLEQALTNYEF